MSFTTLPFSFILEFDDFEDIFEGDVVGEECLTSFAVGLCFKCGPFKAFLSLDTIIFVDLFSISETSSLCSLSSSSSAISDSICVSKRSSFPRELE